MKYPPDEVTKEINSHNIHWHSSVVREKRAALPRAPRGGGRRGLSVALTRLECHFSHASAKHSSHALPTHRSLIGYRCSGGGASHPCNDGGEGEGIGQSHEPSLNPSARGGVRMPTLPPSQTIPHKWENSVKPKGGPTQPELPQRGLKLCWPPPRGSPSELYISQTHSNGERKGKGSSPRSTRCAWQS